MYTAIPVTTQIERSDFLNLNYVLHLVDFATLFFPLRTFDVFPSSRGLVGEIEREIKNKKERDLEKKNITEHL